MSQQERLPGTNLALLLGNSRTLLYIIAIETLECPQAGGYQECEYTDCHLAVLLHVVLYSIVNIYKENFAPGTVLYKLICNNNN